jgi:hypothetical protein
VSEYIVHTAANTNLECEFALKNPKVAKFQVELEQQFTFRRIGLVKVSIGCYGCLTTFQFTAILWQVWHSASHPLAVAIESVRIMWPLSHRFRAVNFVSL